MRFKGLSLGWYALVLIPAASIAQSTGARIEPMDPTSKAPAIYYDSAFTGYTPFGEEAVADWRKVNDEVATIGGHMGIVGGAGQAGHAGSKPTVKPGAPDRPVVGGSVPVPPKAAPAKPSHH